MENTSKYIQLKNLIKEKAEFRRVLKQHRKTQKFSGERLKNVTFLKRESHYVRDDKGVWKFEHEYKPVIIEEITPEFAQKYFQPYNSYSYLSEESIQELYTIYGILRNERKTKKIKCWEDITNSPHYKGSKIKKAVNDWRD